MTTHDPADLPPTARRILAAAQDILAERGFAARAVPVGGRAVSHFETRRRMCRSPVVGWVTSRASAPLS